MFQRVRMFATTESYNRAIEVKSQVFSGNFVVKFHLGRVLRTVRGNRVIYDYRDNRLPCTCVTKSCQEITALC